MATKGKIIKECYEEHRDFLEYGENIEAKFNELDEKYPSLNPDDEDDKDYTEAEEELENLRIKWDKAKRAFMPWLYIDED